MKNIKLDIQYDDDTKTSAIVYVYGELNDKEYQFVLDTGCALSSICLSEDSKLLKKVGERESSGSFGTEKFDIVEIDKFSFNGINLENIPFSRANSNKITKKLLGMNVLKNFSMAVSYKNSSLMLDSDKPKDCKWDEILPDKNGYQPYINVKCGKHSLKTLWDTGAGITIVDTNFIDQNPDLFELVGESVGTDSTGNTMVTPNYKIKSLEIGGHQFAPHEVVAIDLSHVNSKSTSPVSIGLGFSTLVQADWFFDFKSNQWAITDFHS